jgi:hypothetical protein
MQVGDIVWFEGRPTTVQTVSVRGVMTDVPNRDAEFKQPWVYLAWFVGTQLYWAWTPIAALGFQVFVPREIVEKVRSHAGCV